MRDDVGVGFVDTVGEVVLPQVLPNVLDRTEFGRVRWQRQQVDVIRHDQRATTLMLSCPVEGEHGMDVGRHASVDLLQMQVHYWGVDARQDQGSSHAARGADGSEQIGPVIALVAWCAGTAFLIGPNVGQTALLADAGLVLPLQLNRLAARMLGNTASEQGCEVFLCASWAFVSC